MSNDVLLGIFGIPAGFGGMYLLVSNPKTKKQLVVCGVIGVYDLIFFATFHWWLKIL